MTHSNARLSALLAISAIGTALILSIGGRELLVATLATLEQHPIAFACVFASWAVIANCLILPAGSLSLIAGGAVLGAPVPAAIWFAAQLASAPFIHRATSLERTATSAMIERYLGASPGQLLARAATDGIWATVVLRLTPILPSAPAALIAAAMGISLRSFMIGSIAAGWVRPLYFASIGAAAGSITRATEVSGASGLAIIAPLALVFCLSAIVFASRLCLKGDKP